MQMGYHPSGLVMGPPPHLHPFSYRGGPVPPMPPSHDPTRKVSRQWSPLVYFGKIISDFDVMGWSKV